MSDNARYDMSDMVTPCGAWIRADELLPPEDIYMLVSDGEEYSVGYYIHYTDGSGYWATERPRDYDIDVKYWMPLPAPPGKED